MTKSKSLKFLSALTLLFALPVATCTGTIAISTSEYNYSSLEKYQGVSKQSNVATLAADEHDNHTDWNELTSSTYTLTEGNWYLTESITASRGITIEEGATVTLCLNGYTLTSGKTSTPYYGIGIISSSDDTNTSFTLDDCSDDETGEIAFTSNVQGRTPVHGVYIENSSNSSSSIDVTIAGGYINSIGSAGVATGVYAYNNSSTSSSIDVTVNGGTITTYAPTSSNPIRTYNTSSTSSIGVTVNGGYLSSTVRYGNYNGFYIVDSTSENTNWTINGGYHSYSTLNNNTANSFVVNAGYFTSSAYRVISSYIPSTSTTKTFSSSDEGLALDGDYNHSYPNAVYVNGINASVPGEICVGSDINNYVTITGNDSNSNYSYSYVGVAEGSGSILTTAGDYEVTITFEDFEEYISLDGSVPKVYYQGSATFDVTIVDHTPSSTASYNESYHWFECTNTYCEQVYTEASGYAMHSSASEENICDICGVTFNYSELYPTTYTVSYTESEDYTVSGLEDSYQANQTVSFTVIVSDSTKEIDYVTWNDNTIEPDASGTYSFTMPEENVVLNISLKDIESEQEPDEDDDQDTNSSGTPNTDTDASSSNGLIWLYIVIPIVAVVLLAIIIIFIVKSRRKKKKKSA